MQFGELRERSNRHDWKSCVPRGTLGSNPRLSALSIRLYRRGAGVVERGGLENR